MQAHSLGRFGDARLERVGSALVASMQHNRTLCLHRLAKGRCQARQFGMFLANSRVSTAEMLIHAGQQTGRRVDRRPANVHLLCRSMHDRMLTDGTPLAECCTDWQEQSRYTVDVPVRGTQPARQATVRLRFGTVSLRRPDLVAGDRADALSLSVVDVKEVAPPAGLEPVRWRLLTTHPVATVEQARQIVAWYRRRRTIEQVFRSLKSHCLRIGDSQMEPAFCFTRLAMVALIAPGLRRGRLIIRSMQLVMARNGSTRQPVTDAVDPADMPALRCLSVSLEGRTEKLKNPHDPVTLAWFCWIVARLGRWSGYTSKGYRPPGPKTMHHGLLRLGGILTGWHMADRSAEDGRP